MHIRTYIQSAMRTDGTAEHYRDIAIGNLNLQSLRLLHASMGLANEAVELRHAFKQLDLVNIKEEIGDACWYFALLYDASSAIFYDVPLPEHLDWTGTTTELCDDYLTVADGLLDAMKKHLFYGKAMNRDLIVGYISRLYRILRALAATLPVKDGVDPWNEALAGNIAKLKIRYPDRFSTARAIHRDIIAERDAVEHGA